MARILVMDDEEPMRALVREMLEGEGYEVVEAARSEEGVKRFRQGGIDLVITDLFMPEHGGLEVIRTLRADYPDVRIIAMSGAGLKEKVDVLSFTEQFGNVPTFSKPFHQAELLEAVKKLLG